MLPQRGPRTQPKVALVHPQSRNPTTPADSIKTEPFENAQLKGPSSEPNAMLKQLLCLDDEEESSDHAKVDGESKSDNCGTGNAREASGGKSKQGGGKSGSGGRGRRLSSGSDSMRAAAAGGPGKKKHRKGSTASVPDEKPSDSSLLLKVCHAPHKELLTYKGHPGRTHTYATNSYMLYTFVL